MISSVPVFLGQSWTQVGELALALVLSSLIGLERQLSGKAAGLRTQAIVGTSSALFLLVSKYGFMDVLSEHVTLDPSRVAAQIVSGIGFLGAGLILTRHGAVRGLTTAASVWETAAIGMAAGAGLWVLALVVTVMHFFITYVLAALVRRLAGRGWSHLEVEVVYEDGRGLLREVLQTITGAGWSIRRAEPHNPHSGTVSLILQIENPQQDDRLISALTAIEGVKSVDVRSDTDFE